MRDGYATLDDILLLNRVGVDFRYNHRVMEAWAHKLSCLVRHRSSHPDLSMQTRTHLVPQIPLVVRAMETYSGCPSVVESCLLFLHTMVAVEPERPSWRRHWPALLRVSGAASLGEFLRGLLTQSMATLQHHHTSLCLDPRGSSGLFELQQVRRGVGHACVYLEMFVLEVW